MDAKIRVFFSRAIARGAGVGAGVYGSPAEAFAGLERILTLAPDPDLQPHYQAAYGRWHAALTQQILNPQSSPAYV